MILLEEAKKLKFEKGVALGRTKHPETLDFKFLLKRLKDEVDELYYELFPRYSAINEKRVMLELADCYNFLDYIHKKIQKELRKEQ